VRVGANDPEDRDRKKTRESDVAFALKHGAEFRLTAHAAAVFTAKSSFIRLASRENDPQKRATYCGQCKEFDHRIAPEIVPIVFEVDPDAKPEFLPTSA
jgi:hypothetical protein